MPKSIDKHREMRETGERLEKARKARGMSQAEVAKAAGVDQTTISKAERGKIHLEDATLGRIADHLGVTLALLRHGTGVGPTTGETGDAKEDSAMRRVEAPLKVLDEALDAAFDKARGHRLVDVDVVREVFRKESIPATCTPEMMVKIAGRLLDAVAELRIEGHDKITMAEILLKVAA